jgi:hypothetical protein
VGDGCAFPYKDGSFDICHSNSVIEHVGGWRRKVAFARETSRVAPCYFHQTPNFWFPWEPHFGTPFFHWLPEPTRLWLAFRRSLGWDKPVTNIDDGMAIVEHASLLTRFMMRHLFPDGEIIGERFGGFDEVVCRGAGGPVTRVGLNRALSDRDELKAATALVTPTALGQNRVKPPASLSASAQTTSSS